MIMHFCEGDAPHYWILFIHLINVMKSGNVLRSKDSAENRKENLLLSEGKCSWCCVLNVGG